MSNPIIHSRINLNEGSLGAVESDFSSGAFAATKPLEVMKTIAASHNSNNANGPSKGMARGPVTKVSSEAARQMVEKLFAVR